ncbi:MAG: putative peptidoglycan glycosyltransferase FtsW [Gemmatimonadaceae bacterium]|nr:putative peptidoglycan glycosyltransferase FtsW [Gemmatimonadaceae bacterium]
MNDTLRVRDRWVMGNEARLLVVVTSALLAFGLATLYSASALVAMNEGHAGWYYAGRQALGLLLAIVVFALAAKIDAQRLEKLAYPIMLVAIVSMLITVLPFTEAISPRVHGSRRFVLGTAVQPSEFGKIAVIVWTAMLLVKKGDQMRRLTRGLLPFLAVIGVLDVLAILEPDFSVAVMYTLVMAIILFAGGVRIGHFVAIGAIAIPVLWHSMLRLQYAIMRVFSFMDADKAPQELSYQLRQSLIAVGSGGFFGRGFGNGRQQYGYVPMGFNDFIAATIGEEWGFLGLTALVLAFAVYTWLGVRIARQARTPFLQLVAIGCTATTAITAYLHIGVVIGLLPTTGLTLPFISYGRTNLLVSMAMTGILVNIGSVRERVFNASATDPLMATA